MANENAETMKNVLRNETRGTNQKRRKTNTETLWNRFVILNQDSAIIRGSYSMNDGHFKIRSRGQQAAPCSVVAIVFGRLFEPKDWTKNFVDRILEYGDKLYRTSVTKNRVNPNVYVTTKLVYPEFYIDDYKCIICSESNNIYGNLFSSKVGCPDLIEGLERFFRLNDSGVVTAQANSVAMWHHKATGFFYYDPGSCGPNGLRIGKEGVACVMRFKKIKDMGELFLKNLDRKHDSRYCIDKVNVLRVTLINRGFVMENSGLVVDKNVLKSLNPVDINDLKLDCTKPVPKGAKSSMLHAAKINKEPLKITISNYEIDERFATEPLVDFKSLDTGYPYYDMEVNVPSTFKELSDEMAILHGWTHEGSEIYKGKGAQNVANCVASIAVKKIHPVKTWVRPKLDEILAIGDALYTDIKLEKPALKTMTSGDLNDTRIKINEKNVYIDVDLVTIVGTINSKVPSVLNLKQGLEEFFLVNINGIIECSSMAIAVWTQDDYYYMFDPRQCDAFGVRIIEEKDKAAKGKKEDGINEKKVKGKCCVIRLRNIDSIFDLFMKNVDPAKKNDRFIIRNISIVDDVPGTRNWNEFQPAEAGKTWILRGTISNNDESFEPDNQGLQGIAMPIVGLINAKDTPPSKWTKETVDDAVRDGDKYYSWCIPPEVDENWSLLPANLKKSFYVKNCKVKIDLDESAIVGDIKASSDSKIFNLQKGLKHFFDNHEFGIVEVKDLSVAVWKFEEELKDKSKAIFYYYYDSNPRNRLGKRNSEGEEGDEEEPVACVVRTLDSMELARLIEINIDPDGPGGNDFALHELKIISIGEPMTDEEIEHDKAIPAKPDLNFYTELTDDSACLNGSFDQSNETIFKNIKTANKQQAANSLIALAMKKLYNPHLWYSEVIDDILKIGDQLTQKNIENLPEDDEGVVARDYLLPIEITDEFDIGVNRVTIALSEEAATGKISELTKILGDFFQENTMGVFRQENVMFPIWKEGDVFFAMDFRGRDDRGVAIDKDGSATVFWFTGIPPLVSMIQSSVPGTDGDFVIDSVSLENVYETRIAENDRLKKTSSGEDLWHNFPKKSDGIWELLGNLTMSDDRFDEKNRNKQSAATAVMAIIFSKAYEPRQWTKEVLDEVIVTGDKLHSQCAARLGNSSIPLVTEITKEFFLSNRRIDLTIKDCVEAGNLSKKSPKIQDLHSGLENFFKKYTSGTLVLSKELNISIWKFGHFYFALLPHGISGNKENTSGIPRLMRFANLLIFSEFIKESLGPDEDYVITSIEVVDWDKLPPWKFDPSPGVRPANLPSLNAFTRLQGIPGAARAILRGGIHQGSNIFLEKIRNKQTASNCIIALGMSIIKNPITWTKKTMDDILAMGSNLHNETLKTLPAKEKLRPNDVIRVFHVGVNVLTADVENDTISGLVAIPPPEPEVKGKGKEKGSKKPAKAKAGKKGTQKRLPPPPPPPIYLEEGLKLFFDKNRAGILVTGRYMTAIWKDQGVYFMYDPRARDFNGLSKNEDGTSCLMWFACIEPFYDLIFANIDENEKYGRYDICRVIVRTVLIESLPCPAGFAPIFECGAPSMPVCGGNSSMTTVPTKTTSKIGKKNLNVEILTEYKIVDEEFSVLQGTKHMNDRFFDVKTRGLQSTAMAAVAIVVGTLHVPSAWTPELVDAILKYGDKLHADTAKAMRPGARNLSPRELLTTFVVADFRVSINIHCHTIAGILHVYDLAEALKLFFRNNCAGILHTASLAVAVMQHYGKYYLFDPRARNEIKSASVTKCFKVESLAQLFVNNRDQKQPTVYTLNAVNVLNIHFFSDSTISMN